MQLAASKKPVQVVMVAEIEEAKISKISADNCVLFYPEASPETESFWSSLEQTSRRVNFSLYITCKNVRNLHVKLTVEKITEIHEA
jgi:hypothetical protein